MEWLTEAGVLLIAIPSMERAYHWLRAPHFLMKEELVATKAELSKLKEPPVRVRKRGVAELLELEPAAKRVINEIAPRLSASLNELTAVTAKAIEKLQSVKNAGSRELAGRRNREAYDELAVDMQGILPNLRERLDAFEAATQTLSELYTRCTEWASGPRQGKISLDAMLSDCRPMAQMCSDQIKMLDNLATVVYQNATSQTANLDVAAEDFIAISKRWKSALNEVVVGAQKVIDYAGAQAMNTQT